MESNERETIAAALADEPGAFEEVIRLYGRRLYAVAYGILQNGAEAEDVVQETFLKAYRLRGKVRGPETFPAWLAALARNGALDVLRRRRTVPLPMSDETAEMADGTAPAASARMAEDELHRHVDSLLAALPAEHRTAVTLRFLENMDYAGIARIMGISQGALRGILGRAMGTLRRELAGSAAAPDLN